MNFPQSAPPDLPPLVIRSADLPRHGTIVPFRGSQADGYYDPPHTHDRAQFSYRIEGFSIVRIADRRIFLPLGRGVWIPADVVHEVTCRGPAAYNAFYAAPDLAPQPDTVRVMEVSDLLHALIEALIEEGSDAAPDRQGPMCNLILNEIERATDVAGTAPIMPQSPRLRDICEELVRQPAQRLDLDVWAVRAGMSRRTFTRAFRQETGLSPGKWYQQLRMDHIDRLLEQGVTLQQAAFRLGYSSSASLGRAYGRAGR